MALSVPIDGPPPSPATSPAAAQEAGQPLPIDQLAQPMQLQPAGPDLSGVLTLVTKLIEGLLTLSQAVPLIAPQLSQAQAIIENAAGQFSSQVSGGASGSGSMPMQSGGPVGAVVTQAGPQFPGSLAGGKPF